MGLASISVLLRSVILFEAFRKGATFEDFDLESCLTNFSFEIAHAINSLYAACRLGEVNICQYALQGITHVTPTFS